MAISRLRHDSAFTTQRTLDPANEGPQSVASQWGRVSVSQPQPGACSIRSSSGLPPPRTDAVIVGGEDVLLVGPGGKTLVVHPVKDAVVMAARLAEGWSQVNRA